MTESLKDALKSERLKYIYEQLKFHNEGVYRDFAVFQKIGISIAGAGISLYAAWPKLGLASKLVVATFKGLLGILSVVGGLTVISIVCHVLSWLDYRKEEVILFDKEVKRGYREMPRLSHFWRWRETYVLLAIATIVIGAWFFVLHYVLPVG